MLVNLTCGRNPWKKASLDDSTFQAYLKNPKFLSTILPLSPELETILRRIFEWDPRRRINLPELRNLVLRCPSFTKHSTAAPLTPPPEQECWAPETFHTNFIDSRLPYPHQHDLLQPSVVVPQIPTDGLRATFSRSHDGSCSSDDGSTFSSSSSSSARSSGIDQASYYPSTRSQYVPAAQPFNFYGNFFPLDAPGKPLGNPGSANAIPVY